MAVSFGISNQVRSKHFKTHPEMQEGEVFLTNSFNKKRPIKSKLISTLRKGHNAYNIHGEIDKGSVPWFIQKEELEILKARLRAERTSEQILNYEFGEDGWLIY